MTSSYKPFEKGRLRGVKAGLRLKGLLAFAGSENLGPSMLDWGLRGRAP